MSNEKEKRMIGDTGYEVKQALHIGDKEILLAENYKADDGLFYLVCNYNTNGIFEEFPDAVASDDYLEMVQEFVDRVQTQVATMRDEQAKSQTPEIFTAEHCFPRDYAQDITGKIVAIKADTLRAEYRRGDVQLVLVNGGNGAMANPRGNAVYCYHLNNGKQTRFERYEVLGEIKPECLPEWAKAKATEFQAERPAPQRKSKDKGDAR